MKKGSCALLVALHLAGCTTLNRYPHGSEAIGSLQPGDRVTLSVDGTVRIFEVVSVSGGEVCGTKECASAEHVVSVERKEFSLLRTVGFIVLVGLIVAAGAAATSSGFNMSGASLWGR